MKNLIFTLLVVLTAPAAFAAENLTADEKAFLRLIAAQAVKTVDANLVNANTQYDCIKNYMANPQSCAVGRDSLAAIREAYMQYRSQYLLANYDEMMRSYSLVGMGPSFFNMGTPFSRHLIRVDLKEVQSFRDKRRADEALVNDTTDSCTFTRDDYDSFYQISLAQIVSLVPVVLFIEIPVSFFGGKQEGPPRDADILKAYEEMIDGLRQTREQFVNYDQDDLQGLYAYQMLAEQVVKTNQQKWLPVFESLGKKLLPQNVMQHFMVWAQNTFFSLNVLFIGCAVISAGAGMPFLALACSAAAAINQGISLVQSAETFYQYQREWVSGVRDWESYDSQRIMVAVDFVLLMINLQSVRSAYAALPSAEVRRLIAYITRNGAQADRAVVEAGMKRYIQQLIEENRNIGRDEMIGLGIGYMFRQSLEMRDLNRIAQVSTDVLLQYRTTGAYTFKDRYQVLCRQAGR